MRSLKFELGTIMKYADYWYDAVETRLRKRKPTVTRLRKRKPTVETDDGVRKRKRGGGLEMVEAANQYPVPDEDYLKFLSCIGSNAEEDEEEEEEDDNDDDPDYKIFLKNLRANEGAYIFEMKKGAKRTRINYEDESPENVRTEDEDNDNSTPDDDIGGRGKKRRLNVNENENERRKRNNSNQMRIRPFLEYCEPGDVARADASYIEFLSHLRVKDNSLVFEHKEVDVSSEDEESEEYQGIPCRTKENSPLHTTLKEVFRGDEDDNHNDNEDDNHNDNEDDNHNNNEDDDHNDNEDGDDTVQSLGGFDLESEYGKKLIKELQAPFKWKEYEDLLKAAKMNKERVRDRELRRGWKTYSTGKERISYLEHHPDLGRMVDQAIAKNDKRRALNLLRCLFYYLKHLSHDDAFVPWKDLRILGMIRSHSISKTI